MENKERKVKIELTKSEIRILKASLDIVLYDVAKARTEIENEIKRWNAVGIYTMPETIIDRIEIENCTYKAVHNLLTKIESAKENENVD